MGFFPTKGLFMEDDFFFNSHNGWHSWSSYFPELCALIPHKHISIVAVK